jgi:hypothetical protein
VTDKLKAKIAGIICSNYFGSANNSADKIAEVVDPKTGKTVRIIREVITFVGSLK